MCKLAKLWAEVGAVHDKCRSTASNHRQGALMPKSKEIVQMPGPDPLTDKARDACAACGDPAVVFAVRSVSQTLHPGKPTILHLITPTGFPRIRVLSETPNSRTRIVRALTKKDPNLQKQPYIALIIIPTLNLLLCQPQTPLKDPPNLSKITISESTSISIPTPISTSPLKEAFNGNLGILHRSSQITLKSFIKAFWKPWVPQREGASGGSLRKGESILSHGQSSSSKAP